MCQIPPFIPQFKLKLSHLGSITHQKEQGPGIQNLWASFLVQQPQTIIISLASPSPIDKILPTAKGASSEESQYAT